MRIRIIVVLASCFLGAAVDAYGQQLEWIRELGVRPEIAADGTEAVYVVYPFDNRRLLSRYNADGELQWEVTFANPNDRPAGVVNVAVGAGGVYVTEHVFIGGFPFQYDSTIRKYDESGALQWTQQSDTGPIDQILDVAVDGVGNVYFTSENSPHSEADVLSKLSASGAELWTQNLTTDAGYILSVDSDGNAFVVGQRSGDWFDILSKYDAAGQLQWTQVIVTTSNDVITGVSADNLGNVYVAGHTSGSLGGPNLGGDDAYVAKYNTDGALLWSRQFGTSDEVHLWGVASDGLEGVYIAGMNSRNPIDWVAGDTHGFAGKLDANGNMQWLSEFGSVSFLSYPSTDGRGSIYASGGDISYIPDVNEAWVLAKITDMVSLDGDFDGNGIVDGADLLAWQRGESPSPLSADDFADWQARFGTGQDAVEPTGVPEPSTLACAIFGLLSLAARSRRGKN